MTNTLTSLNLTDCGLGPESGEVLGKLLLDNTELKLETFCAGRDRLEDGGAQALALAFSQMGSLRRLELFQNGIAESGMVALLGSLNQNTELEVLKLNDNWLKDAAVDKLIEVLPSLPHLRELDISDCMTGSTGVRRICEALKKFCGGSLQALNLAFGELDDRHEAHVALRALAGMKALVSIQLQGNEFSGKLKEHYAKKMEELGKKVQFKEVSEDSEDEDEEEEDEDEDELTESGDDEKDLEEVSESLAQMKINNE